MMDGIRLYLDAAMCILWMLTYTLTLIGILRYRYPLISPVTPLVVAPLEFSCLLLFFKIGAFRFDYASIAYLYWVIIEGALIFVLIKFGYIKKGWIAIYLEALAVLVAVMVFAVTIKEKMLFFTYFNTLVGVVFWLIYLIRSKGYPLSPLTAAIFILQTVADLISIPVYFHSGNWLVSVMAVLLPVLNAFCIVVFVVKCIRKSKKKTIE